MTDELQIRHLTDAMSFRVSRFASINEYLGSKHFRREFGVSLSEWRVLGLVAEGNPATTRALRDTLLMDRGLLSRVVKALRSRGLVRSQVCASDKRQAELFLTDEGRALHRACIAFTDNRNKAMASALTAEEQAEFNRLLDVLIASNAALIKTKEYADD
ncbi:MarR family transcriptional regulator [Rhodobacteraceae bacterium D3-12]|nr:MarR family transcriptional regulator [Rhodobacteraceae bacterium D3-12]